MQHRVLSSTSVGGGGHRPTRSRPLTAMQERLFLALLFAVGICLQLAAVLLQASAPG
jgi:hypothetical protein